MYILQDKYVLSGLVFLGFMAIENAVAAVIPHSDAQRLFDRICLYVGVGCFLCIHVVALTFVIIKVTNFILLLIELIIELITALLKTLHLTKLEITFFLNCSLYLCMVVSTFISAAELHGG